MSEPKFTKGPWQSEISSEGDCRVNSDSGFENDCWIIANLYGPDAEANQSLIAAAPELYGALKELLHAVHTESYEGMKPAATKAQTALAKARGEHE